MLDLQFYTYNLGRVVVPTDGATEHTAQNSLNVLREMFPQRLASYWDYIIGEVNAIPRYISNQAIQNFIKRLQQCVDAHSRHLGDIIYQT